MSVTTIGLLLALGFYAYLIIDNKMRREKFRRDCDAKILASRQNCDLESENFWRAQKARANSKYF